MSKPLAGIKVLDFAHLLPGELCSTILSDLGCEVTRVESLKPGLAHRLPPLVKGESLYYWSLHRNKRRIALDLKNEKGVQVVRRLAEKTDVIVQNFRPGVMDRLGIGYNDIKAVNQRLVYCSISGYGQKSAWSQRPGHDLNYVAETGILSLNRLPGGPPVLPSVLVSDYTSAIYAALAIAAALYEREHTGKGKSIDISMFECALSTLNILATMLLYTGQQPESPGFTNRAELPNYTVYETSDGRHLAVASLEPKFWEEFCSRIGRADLIGRYPSGPDAALREEIAAVVATRTLGQWSETFDGASCCVSPVHTLEEALSYLPARERGVITHIVHPILGAVPQMATPVLNREGAQAGKSMPDAAVETVRLLKQLGFSEAELDDLRAENVIATGPGPGGEGGKSA